MNQEIFNQLLEKYDVPVPRYTSYPTVPAWSQTPTQNEWIKSLKNSLSAENASYSMYLHLPFCETLCTFCGCNTIITKDHSKANPYIELILKEWNWYLNHVEEFKTKPLKHIHLGGGSPTFLSSKELTYLISEIFKSVKKIENHFEASIEVDPRRTTDDQLMALREIGFNRISFGVQDFNSEVQRLIHREQPFEMTQRMTLKARELGYNSVNFDLIYGLPAQTLERMKYTLEKTLELKPDRIAFYSFALVPWIKPAQRLFKDSDLPSSTEKRALYELGRQMFLEAGYIDVGMDHFALPSDELFKARENKSLSRNFMGYTDQKTEVLLGLGVSSISESLDQFHQNEKLLPKYQEMILNQHLATHRGHVLSDRDVNQKQIILKLMTQFEYEWKNEEEYLKYKDKLIEFEKNDLIELSTENLKIKKWGKPFLRNICARFDDYYTEPKSQTFSKSI